MGDEVVAVGTLGEAIGSDPRNFDVVVADEIEIVQQLAAEPANPPAILLADPERIGDAATAFAAGAADVVAQASDMHGPLRLAIGRAMERRRLESTIADLERRLEESTRVDPVSGLYTEKYFRELLEREADRIGRFGGTMALLRLRLPAALGVERTLGLHVRDRLMHEVGAILRGDLRLLDLAGVWPDGGFVVALNGADQAGAERVVERLEARLSELEDAIGLGRELIPRPEILVAGGAAQIRAAELD